MAWKDIVNTPEYLELTPQERKLKKVEYWQTNKKRIKEKYKLDDSQIGDLRKKFFGKSFVTVSSNEIPPEKIQASQAMQQAVADNALKIRATVKRDKPAPEMEISKTPLESVDGPDEVLEFRVPYKNYYDWIRDYKARENKDVVNYKEVLKNIGNYPELRDNFIEDQKLLRPLYYAMTKKNMPISKVWEISKEDPETHRALKNRLKWQFEDGKFGKGLWKVGEIAKRISNISNRSLKGFTFGVVDQKMIDKILGLGTKGASDVYDLLKIRDEIMGTSVAEEFLGALTEIGGAVGSAGGVGKAIGKGLSGVKNNALRFILTRAATSASTVGGRRVVDAIKKDIPWKQAVKTILKDSAIAAGGSLIGMIPEHLIKPGIINLVSQVGTDVTYDVLMDAAEGRLPTNKDEMVGYLTDLGVRNAASLYFASDDFLRRNTTFKEQQRMFREGLKPEKTKIDKIKTGDFKIEPVKEAGAIQKKIRTVSKLFGATPDVNSKATKAIIAGEITKARMEESIILGKMEKESKMWQKRYDADFSKKFIVNVEKGRISKKSFSGLVKNPGEARELSKKALELNKRLNKVWEDEKEAGVRMGWVENYLPHMWENPKKAGEVFSKYLKQGVKDPFWTKKRKLNFIEEGLKNGLKLKTYVPEELTALREISSKQNLMMINTVKKFDKSGLLKTHDIKKPIPLGWAEVDSKLLRGYLRLGGKNTRGTFIMPEMSANIVKNWLSAKSWSKRSGAYKSVMTAKNMLVPVRLALSGFHVIETAHTGLSDRLATAVFKMSRGDMKGAAKLFGEFAAFPYALGKDLYKGRKFVNAYFKEAKTEEQKVALEMMKRGGFDPKREARFKPESFKQIKSDLYNHKYIRALAKVLPASADILSKPIMDHWVPYLKTASYFRNAAEFLAGKGRDMSPTEQNIELKKISDEMDNRFGQMQYDKNFWNKFVKDMGVMSTLSLGWNVGTIRGIGGATGDTVKYLKDIITKGGGDITRKMVYWPMYTGTVMLFGGVMTYIMTGKKPEELLDYFYPPTGNVNLDGSKERLMVPAMTKDFFALKESIRKEGVIGGPITWGGNKLSPVLSDLVMMFRNRDFYGNEIAGKYDKWYEQGLQLMEWWAKQQRPFAVSASEQMKKKTGKASILPYVGFPLAPGYVTKTKEQKMISDMYGYLYGGKVRTRAQAEKMEKKRAIRELIRSGKNKEKLIELVRKGRKEGLFGEDAKTDTSAFLKAYKRFKKGAKMPGDVYMFRRLPEEYKAILKEKMSDKKWKYYTTVGR